MSVLAECYNTFFLWISICKHFIFSCLLKIITSTAGIQWQKICSFSNIFWSDIFHFNPSWLLHWLPPLYLICMLLCTKLITIICLLPFSVFKLFSSRVEEYSSKHFKYTTHNSAPCVTCKYGCMVRQTCTFKFAKQSLVLQVSIILAYLFPVLYVFMNRLGFILFQTS